MARIIRLEDQFTDTALPVLRDDGVLSSGSLILAELAHPANPVTGLPAAGALIPNIAAKNAAAILGVAASSATLQPIYRRTANFTGAIALAERTTKGGLHSLITQSAWTSATGLFHQAVETPSFLLPYYEANETHDYYWSVWGRITRRVKTGAPDYGDVWAGVTRNVSGAISGSPLLQNLALTSRPRPSGDTPARLGARYSNENTVGPIFMGIGLAQTMDNPLAASDYSDVNYKSLAFAGRHHVWGADAPHENALRSWVWYRTYVEDLTVSGRTYAEVDALEYAEYQKQVLTVGGRYYGDTFTNPTALP